MLNAKRTHAGELSRRRRRHFIAFSYAAFAQARVRQATHTALSFWTDLSPFGRTHIRTRGKAGYTDFFFFSFFFGDSMVYAYGTIGKFTRFCISPNCGLHSYNRFIINSIISFDYKFE